jgi:hypothetical protein
MDTFGEPPHRERREIAPRPNVAFLKSAISVVFAT